jgi:RNA polymerase sigma factor (sigma-70 family)
LPQALSALRFREMSERDPIGSLDGPPDGPDFDLLYRNHAPRLRRRLCARVKSHDEANDLVQDAFARLLGARSLSSVRDPGAFLNRIVRNLLIDRSRRLSTRSPHVSIGVEAEVAVAPDQGQAIEVEQMRQRYREVVALLPPRTREVFILHRVDGIGYKEIAARLDISVRTVEWHMAQALIRISRGLDGE